MKRVRWFSILLFMLVAVVAFSACKPSKKYIDGTYTAQSGSITGTDGEEGVGDGYGVVKITLMSNKVVSCDFSLYTADGVLKDSEFGKENGEIKDQDYYKRAQKEVLGAVNYAEQLAAKGSLDQVSSVSGAASAYAAFREAVAAAFEQAKK